MSEYNSSELAMQNELEAQAAGEKLSKVKPPGEAQKRITKKILLKHLKALKSKKKQRKLDEKQKKQPNKEAQPAEAGEGRGVDDKAGQDAAFPLRINRAVPKPQPSLINPN